MNKAKWQESYSSLRKVLRRVPNITARDSFVDYKFGICMVENKVLVWNGTARHVIAAIDFNPDIILMRYRYNSRYAATLSNFNFDGVDGRKTKHIRSKNMKKYRRAAKPILDVAVREAISTRRRARGLPIQEQPEGRDMIGINIATADTWEGATHNLQRATRGLIFANNEVLVELAQAYHRHLRRMGNAMFSVRYTDGLVRQAREGERPYRFEVGFDNQGQLVMHDRGPGVDINAQLDDVYRRQGFSTTEIQELMSNVNM